MALINEKKKEINAKIIFFGAPAAGKKSNLEAIHGKLKPEMRSPMKMMAVGSDTALFFDFLPGAMSAVDGYTLRFHLYTVSGKVSKTAAWKTVLKGADGIVFVVDSSRPAENGRWLDALQQLVGAGSLDDIPLVFQYNKRDAEGAAVVEDLQRSLNRFNAPAFPAVATAADGVMATVSAIVKMVMPRLQGEAQPVAAGDGAEAGIPVEVPVAAAAPEMPLTPPPSAAAPQVTVGEPVMEGRRILIPVSVQTGGCETVVTLAVTLDILPES